MASPINTWTITSRWVVNYLDSTAKDANYLCRPIESILRTMLASFTTVPNNGLFSTAFFLTLALMDEDLSRKPGDLGCRKISNTLAIQERSQEFDDKHPLLLDYRRYGNNSA